MASADVSASIRSISDELERASTTVAEADLSAFAALLDDAERVFVHGAGRSGLALRMTAMRLMHLGKRVHVVGETTAPAIGDGDVLLTASGSGSTGAVVTAARTAAEAGAGIAAITAVADSPLGELADAVVVVPAAAKLDRTGAASAQYAGSLFEQTVVVVGDAVFDALWHASGATADDLWPRHANLE
ncbi:SIS domain-containing protein [Agrococcus versicolor]|uniref:SIS domain-containing protein n=1 Tax=Agrococcus versicolor TaxID=501482 RepID=A0ABP5MBQ0_9MICO